MPWFLLITLTTSIRLIMLLKQILHNLVFEALVTPLLVIESMVSLFPRPLPWEIAQWPLISWELWARQKSWRLGKFILFLLWLPIMQIKQWHALCVSRSCRKMMAFVIRLRRWQRVLLLMTQVISLKPKKIRFGRPLRLLTQILPLQRILNLIRFHHLVWWLLLIKITPQMMWRLQWSDLQHQRLKRDYWTRLTRRRL